MSSTTSHQHKYIALDSLRGIAAIMVIFQHFWEINNPSDARLKPWLFFCAGHEAVILFFVLSGFVLTHQLRNYSFKNYPEFIVRRILRIYPAYYVSIILSGSLLYYFQHYHPSTLNGYGLTRWFYIWSSSTFDSNMIINSILLITHNGNSLNVVVWTLYFEMWISILFPMIILGFRHNGIVFRLLLLSGLVYISWRFFTSGKWIDDEWQAISYYLWYFIIGSLLYIYHDKIKAISGSISLMCGLALYFINYLTFGKISDRLEHELILSIGCTLILLNGIHYKLFQKFLLNRLFAFYGKISYSLYLFHLPVMYGLSYWLLEGTNLIIIKVLTFISTTFIAWLSYSYIELSGIKLAKILFKK